MHRFPTGAILALLCVTAIAIAADPPELTIRQTIQNDPEGAPSRMRRNTGVHVRGEFVYVSSYYGSAVNYFRRDAATGKLAFAGALEFDGPYRGASLAFAGQIMYAVIICMHR